jgi:thiol:disulfide interchange protein DsbD
MNRNCLIALLFVLTEFSGVRPAAAGGIVETPQTRAALIVDRTQVAPGASFSVGLSLTLKQGWHTYWRTPGDSGLPAEVTWTLPSGWTAGPIAWPTPMRVPTGDLMNFGYEGQVILPISVALAGNTAMGPAELKAHATWLACAEICIPEDGEFSVPVVVAATPGPDSPDADAIRLARKQIPQPAPWPVAFSYGGNTLKLVADFGPDASGIASAAFFPDGDGIIVNAAPQSMKARDGKLDLTVAAGAKRAVSITGILVVEDSNSGRTGYEVSAPVTPSGFAQKNVITFLIAVTFAFLGGLILNVMPCVLPVLVMKVVSVTNQNASLPALRRDSLIYTAGVASAFTGLAGMILILRSGGEAIGWGFQLQSPAFVAILANVMLACGLNLSGVFPIGGNVMGFGQSWTTKGGFWGPYLTGVLAVVVATPCTAPFMGTAVGFAFTQSPLTAIAVFEGLALGLAFPYLAVAFIPGFARVIPRPGPWMDRLKQVLAFGLYGAAAWLLWVLTQQLDPSGTAIALAGLLCMTFAAWSWGVAAAGQVRAWAVVALVALVLCLAALGALRTHPASNQSRNGADVELSEPFTAMRLAELRAEGKPVFVNFTAAWCITCLLNERVALSRPEVADALRTRGIVYLKGDWTNRSPEITRALHELGRDGVPVYALYPTQGAPILLPQVLTPRMVVDTLTGL